MVNPVINNSISQATLNPFQKRVEDQIKNPAAQDAQRNATANQDRTENNRSQNQPVAQASAQSNDGPRNSAAQQRGSLLDVTV